MTGVARMDADGNAVIVVCGTLRTRGSRLGVV